VQGVKKELLEDIRKETEDESPYPDAEPVDLPLRTKRELPSEALERTFKEYFAASNPTRFDKTLFHYLLNRLGEAKSRVAVSYCLDALQERAEETQAILKYFSVISPTEEDVRSVVGYMMSPTAVYDYQCYQLLKWLSEEQIKNEDVLKYCRRIVHDFARDLWLRSWAIAYLGDTATNLI